MAEIVNLRQARKRKARAEQADKAAGQRAKFGRSRAERDVADSVRSIEARRLDGLRIERHPAATSPSDA